MSIASEITSIGENLKKGYQSIANLGADLTNVDKNIENIAELLDGVYDRLPKTEFEEGESVTLENTLKGKLDYENGVVGIGQSSQESTQGYQLLDLYETRQAGQVISRQGLIWTINDDGSITITGKTTEAFAYLDVYSNENKRIGDINTAYTFVLKNTTDTNLQCQWYDRINGGWANRTTSAICDVHTNDSNSTGSIIRILIADIDTTINARIYPMIIKGSYNTSTAPNYEKYTNGASPNPSYPQEIKCVTGNQDVVVSGKNLFEPVLTIDGTNIGVNNSSLTQVINGEFSFVASGSDLFFGNVRNEGMAYENSRGIKIYRNGNSKISYRCSNDSFNKNFFTAYDKNDISLGYTIVGSSGTGTYTFPDNCEYVTFRFGNGAAVSGTTYKTKVILAYGDTIPDYEPYHTPKTYQFSLGDHKFYGIGTYRDYILRTTGKNKCNITSATGWLYSSGLPGHEDTGIVVDSFESNKITYHSNTNSYLEVLTNNIQLKPNTKYTITFNRTSTATNNQFFIYNYIQGSGYTINYRDNNTNVYEVTFTTSNNGIVVLGFGFGNVTGSATVSNIMLEEGSTASDYQPYGVGNWYKVNNVGEYTFTGNEEFYSMSTQRGFNVFTPHGFVNNMITDNDIIACMCNYFKGNSWANRYNENDVYGLGTSNQSCSFITNQFESNNAFKLWLSTANLVLYYVLATPTYTPITGTLAEQLEAWWNGQSLDGTTIIEGNGDLPMLINVRALKGAA